MNIPSPWIIKQILLHEPEMMYDCILFKMDESKDVCSALGYTVEDSINKAVEKINDRD